MNKSAQTFLITSQSASFGTRFCDDSQKSSYTCNNTLHRIVLIPLCYGESSLRIPSCYAFPLFLYDPSKSHLQPQNYFNRHRFFLLILILIYFLCTPLHGLAFYSFNYPVCLFPSYLNLAFVYFKKINATIYLMYLLHVTEFTS